MTRYRLVNDFAAYEIENPILVESALHGLCLRGRFRVEGTDRWDECGDFRVDTASVIERVDEQLELRAA